MENQQINHFPLNRKHLFYSFQLNSYNYIKVFSQNTFSWLI